MVIIGDRLATVKCKIAIKALLIHFDLFLSVKLDSFSCSLAFSFFILNILYSQHIIVNGTKQHTVHIKDVSFLHVQSILQ